MRTAPMRWPSVISVRSNSQVGRGPPGAPAFAAGSDSATWVPFAKTDEGKGKGKKGKHSTKGGGPPPAPPGVRGGSPRTYNAYCLSQDVEYASFNYKRANHFR